MDIGVDPRFHRQPGNGMPEPETQDGWFSGRTISEKILYPWMVGKEFRTAKSGWQTRTYERPHPYTLDYPENIAIIKYQFLKVLDYASKNNNQCHLMVAYLFRKEMYFRKTKVKLVGKVANSNIGNNVLIADIATILEKHFTSPNSSLLPVIAIYSIYQVLIGEVKNYKDIVVIDLESHQASDLRTGSVGDVELKRKGRLIEGVEVKHGIEIDLSVVLRAKEKILKTNIERYYILTTHANCGLNDNRVSNVIREVYKSHGCQIIVNGVIPTIRYYLRMCRNPSIFLEKYAFNISRQKDVTALQLEVWIKILNQYST